MTDIWWGLCGAEPGQYNFCACKALCSLLASVVLELQATMSFHQCCDVGDPISIPIPAFALSVAREKDMLYRHAGGDVSEDCLSLSADNQRAFAGKLGPQTRTPLDCYRDYIAVFLSSVGAENIGTVITELQVGMGPCGELRYPSYMMSKGWNYPGVGLVMADDTGMRSQLKANTGLSGRIADREKRHARRLAGPRSCCERR